MRSSAILRIQIDDKYCFIWSILAHLHPIADSKNGHATRVSNHRQYFIELNIEGFIFSNGFRCSDVYTFGKLNNLSINIFESNFYQEQNICKHKLIPIEVSKNDSDRVIDFLISKNRDVLFEKLFVI